MSSDFILQYGPVVPDAAINLAWINPPPLDPDENIVMMNIVGQHPSNDPMFYRETVPNSAAYTVTYESSTCGHISIPDGILETVHHPIQVMRPVEDETGAWHVLLADGSIKVRTYYSSSEDSSSWLYKAAAEEGWVDGDQLYLIYSLPETLTEPYLSTTAGTFDGDWNIKGMPVSGEYAAFVDEHTIALNNGKVYSISSIKINGSELIGGSYPITPDTLASFDCLQGADFDSGVLTLTTSISQSDLVQVSYKYSQQFYHYRGYYDEDLGRFCDLDLNPSYGHTYDNGRPSSELLASVIYIYLLPSAAYRYTDALSGNVKIKTALKYTDQLIRWESGPALTLATSLTTGNTPGQVSVGAKKSKSVYGLCWYDKLYFMNKLPPDSPTVVLEDGSLGGNLQAGGVGSLAKHPSALVLAKLYVSPNGTINSVQLVDTRSRGGGIAEDIDEATLTGTELAELATYWDVGGWEGELAMLNGVVVVELPESLLTGENGSRKFTEREIEDIVSKHVAAGIKPIIRYKSG